MRATFRRHRRERRDPHPCRDGHLRDQDGLTGLVNQTSGSRS
jgi:hypothetical protein